MVSVAARRASGKSGYEHLSIPQTTFLPSCLSQGAQVMGRYVCLLPDPLSKRELGLSKVRDRVAKILP